MTSSVVSITNDSIATMTISDLREALTVILTQDFASKLLTAARIWKRLEELGDDLSDLRSGIGSYLPAISEGTILPEVVIKYAGQPKLLRTISSLTPSEQKKIIETGTVSVVESDGKNYTHRMLPLHSLLPNQLKQVFGDRVIRNETEQIALLSRPIILPKKNVTKQGSISIHKERQMLRIGGVWVEPSQVVSALAELSTSSSDHTPDKPCVVKLTEDEKRKLDHATINANTTQQDMIRSALRSLGLI